ncbi:olfactory receptor 8S1-like [Hemicordylus capensis]|uniref:olfactory receptor 8S1-like n=1 Tax=Hemicordylus capensis TaxID=884348 RepID=UPI002304BE3F|nr:olfactory receptor 8S1-like [Hemicordylus capensis]
MENQTVIKEFILLGLSSDPHLQVVLFLIFLIIYAVTLLGNSAIMLVIRTEVSLHTPMFFFLSHLAFVDICYSTVTVPKMLENTIAMSKTISREACTAQIFFFFQAACAEVFILSAMAYDRYVAICKPLHYMTIMKKAICKQLVGGAWAMGLLYAVVNTFPLETLHFCRNNTISHYSCELPSVLSLSCTPTLTNYIVLLISVLFFGAGSFCLTLISYIYIISTILKISSAEGRSKAFSTCRSHLIVVGLFYVTAFFRYLKPNSDLLVDLDKVISIQYSILTPMLNPIIYSLRNKEIKVALGKMFGKRIFLQ